MNYPRKHLLSHRYLSSPQISAQPHQQDFLLLGCVVFLSIFGLIMVYDSSQIKAFADLGDKYYFIKQQIIWTILGFGSLSFFSYFNYHRLQKIATPLFLLTLILLLLVFVPGLGVLAGGAHRWLRILGFTLQPAEIIKLSSIIFFSILLQKKNSFFPFIFLTFFIVLTVGLFQKDLGTTVVFSIIALSIYFVSGASIFHFVALLILGIVGFCLFILTSSYRRQRVLAFLDPFADPQGYSYHISQVLIALGSGGLWGLGVGQSRQKYAYIPEVMTDSIFSVVGEELGFLGGLVLLCLISFLVWRGLKVADAAPDLFGKLLASGLTIWIGAQAAINLAAMVSLIPLTGVPLPFISYGGSALLANLVAIGILLNISKQTNIK